LQVLSLLALFLTRTSKPLTHRKDFRRLRFRSRDRANQALSLAVNIPVDLLRGDLASIARETRNTEGKRRMARIGRLTALVALAWVLALGERSFALDTDLPVAVGATLSQDASAAKLVFDLSRSVEARVFALTSPDRIVIDLPEVNFQLAASTGHIGPTPDTFLVRGFRFGLLAPGKSRIVIDLGRPACPGDVSAKPIVDSAPAARLTIELDGCPRAAFTALVRSQVASFAGAATAAIGEPPIIVVDPGHGGADGGARGLGGVQEKTLVYEFCSELKRQLDSTHRYNIVMTRNGDQYVDLDDRVEIARAANASLFISVHADTLSDATDVRGATIYTASDRASDPEAARIAARENAADGASAQGKRSENPDVADILFDLKRRETRAYAHIFSRQMVGNLRDAGNLNHNPERSAGFVVLKAPEFPSVLIELGYLSNAKDVQALASAEWRTKTASAMVNAIDSFFARSKTQHTDASNDSGVALTNGQNSPRPDPRP
jgi:N-acetylmuramoyl-L-alanine amidase